jgi:phosphoribosylanthranilate isomerase
MLKIKVCGMRDSDNILKISELEPDYMGFIFYPQSKRFFGTNFRLIRKVPGIIEKVGVFVNEKPDTILKIAEAGSLNLIQLHGSESPAFCDRIRSEGYRIIKTFAIDRDFDFSILPEFQNSCDFFLFDTKSDGFGGSGNKFDWDLIERYSLDYPFFISGGITLSDFGSIKEINNPNLYSIDINSRFETEPGVKDILMVGTFINHIRKQ